MKVLRVDVSGDWAHFRRYYTTSSPLTFALFPPTAIFGFIGSILGLEKEGNEYLQHINGRTAFIAVQLLHPVKKLRMGINHVNTKGNIWVPKQRREGARTQIRVEYLRDPAYRLYLHLRDQERFEQLIHNVKQGLSVYTPCLGQSELLATIRYAGLKEYERYETSVPVPIATAIVAEALYSKGIVMTDGLKLHKETLPLDMNPDRSVPRYAPVVYNAEAGMIQAKVQGLWRGEEGDFITGLVGDTRE